MITHEIVIGVEAILEFDSLDPEDDELPGGLKDMLQVIYAAFPYMSDDLRVSVRPVDRVEEELAGYEAMREGQAEDR